MKDQSDDQEEGFKVNDFFFSFEQKVEGKMIA